MQIRSIDMVRPDPLGKVAKTAYPVLDGEPLRYERVSPHEVLVRYLTHPSHRDRDDTRVVRERWIIDEDGYAQRQSTSSSPAEFGYGETLQVHGEGRAIGLRDLPAVRY